MELELEPGRAATAPKPMEPSGNVEKMAKRVEMSRVGDVNHSWICDGATPEFLSTMAASDCCSDAGPVAGSATATPGRRGTIAGTGAVAQGNASASTP